MDRIDRAEDTVGIVFAKEEGPLRRCLICEEVMLRDAACDHAEAPFWVGTICQWKPKPVAKAARAVRAASAGSRY